MVFFKMIMAKVDKVYINSHNNFFNIVFVHKQCVSL